MNIRWNIILGVIALALLGWYYSLNQDHGDLQSLIKKPDSPEYVGNKMETTVFSPEG
ncbi:MAG: LPS export ABC transporter periplasmic protein LptC, partial [Haemophilus parainfluenzae]|nr:LPS export ABC transporter periplasmic protein LptC [Haemophilus parainfluenzae]